MADINKKKGKDKTLIEILRIINNYGLPLMKIGVEKTKNEFDDIAYAMIEAGVKKALEVLDED